MGILALELEPRVLDLMYEMVISIPHLDFVLMEIVKIHGHPMGRMSNTLKRYLFTDEKKME